MIYLFRIISDEDQEFLRNLVIDGTDTFLDFHRSLQKNLGYDSSLLASFFITNDMWEKQQEITLIDMMQESGIETRTMDQVTIDEYLNEVNQRLIYVFDFFSERAFFMELIEMSDEISPRETPFIGHSRGDAPAQMALDLLNEEPEEEQDHLRLDDLDPDLFDSEFPDEF
ncbi:MAG: hypothetical protein KAT15_07755 [Bacteroidales bacterium]|nr:hypothetical protein [Bacteroidales bacterium]